MNNFRTSLYKVHIINALSMSCRWGHFD